MVVRETPDEDALDEEGLDPVCPHPIARPFIRQRWLRALDCDTGLVWAAGLPVVGEPVAHWASGVSVRAAAPKRLRRLHEAAEPLVSGV